MYFRKQKNKKLAQKCATNLLNTCGGPGVFLFYDICSLDVVRPPTPLLCATSWLHSRVDQIFRLSCLRQHVLGWVKKRVRRNINFFLSAPSCSAGLPKFLRVLNRTPNFFVRNRSCLVSKDSYFDADSNKIDMAQSKNAPNWSKIEKT